MYRSVSEKNELYYEQFHYGNLQLLTTYETIFFMHLMHQITSKLIKISISKSVWPSCWSLNK